MEYEAQDQSELHPTQTPPEKKMRPASEFAEYDDLVSQLADQLKIARHPDSSVTIKAARILIETILSTPSSLPANRQQQQQQQKQQQQQQNLANKFQRQCGDEIRIQQSKFTLDDVSLPKAILKSHHNNDDDKLTQQVQQQSSEHKSKDELDRTFQRASRALKLLYLDDQKQLQYQVNEIISGIQAITANPKTDPRLLATGR